VVELLQGDAAPDGNVAQAGLTAVIWVRTPGASTPGAANCSWSPCRAPSGSTSRC